MTRVDAIVPAGGSLKPDFQAAAGVPAKAQLPFEGLPMLVRTVRALRACPSVGRIAVVGSPETRALVAEEVDAGLDDLGNAPRNIVAAAKALASLPNAPDRVLVVTCDLPFLAPGMLEDLLTRCQPPLDVHVPVVRREDYERRFPGSSSTWVTIRDGAWTIGGTFLLRVPTLLRIEPDLERVFAQRKSVVGMAKLLGPSFLIKVLTKRLTVPDAEVKIRQLLGCTGAAVYGCATELAFDIDDAEDLAYARTQAKDRT